MLIKTKLSERDFINVNFILMYSRVYVRFLTYLMIFILLTVPITWSLQSKVSFFELLGPLAMLSFFPVVTYFGAKRNYKTNKRIQELIEYQMDVDFFKIKGESFNSQQTWDKISKVTKKKNWILIWQSRQIANPIRRKYISDNEILDLKKLTIYKVKIF